MRRRLALVLLMLLIVPLALISKSVSSPSTGRAAAVNGELIAVPLEGHTGDRIFLSGGYLLKNTTYVFLMACPNWHDPTAIDEGNFSFIQKRGVPATVTTDANGAFVGFSFPAIALHGVDSSSCTIYAGTSTNPYGPELPATYFILAPQDRGKGCAVRMCPQIRVASKRVRPGAREVYTISNGWPGSKVHLSVSFMGTNVATVQKTVRLNWEGVGSLSITVPLTAAHLTCDKVKLQGSIDLGQRYHQPIRTAPCFSVVA